MTDSCPTRRFSDLPWDRAGPGGTPSECVMGNLLRNASQERPMGAIRAMARKHVAPMGRSCGDGLQRTPDWMTQATPGSRSERGNLATAGESDGDSPCQGTP